MMSFKEFYDQQQSQPQIQQQEGKPWKAKKAEVLNFWRNLQSGLPIQMKPVEKGHSGTRFREDGIRVTGSPTFINSVLSRLKDMLVYVNSPGIKLDVEYREIENKSGGPNEEKAFVFYAHASSDDKK